MAKRTADDCDHCAATDRAREMSIARRALAEDDARHAAHHAAAALAFDPNDTESLALVDTLIAWRPKPAPFSGLMRMLGKAPATERAPAFPTHAWWGNHLVRARAAWLDADRAEAFDVLLQIAAVAQHIDLAPWWNRILDEAEKNDERMPVVPYLRAFGAVGQRTIGLLHLRAAERAHVAPWAELGLRLAKHVESAHRGMLAMCTSGLLRRAGRFDEAFRVADGALSFVDGDDAANLHVQRGLALRAAGRFDDAVAAFTAAGLEADHNHGLEVARVLGDAGRVDEAVATYDKYGADDDGEVRAMRDLLKHRRGEAVSDAAVNLARLLDDERVPARYDDLRRLFLGQTSPYVEMSDATTSFLWQQPGAKMQSSAVTALEGPSVRLAMALAGGSTDPRAFGYSADKVPTPDPRTPLDADVGAVLWRVDGDAVVQAVPAPSSTTIDAILSLAVPLRSTHHTWQRARALHAPGSGAPGDGGGGPADVIRALVHPPAAPANAGAENAASWLFRWQRSACLLLAAVDDEHHTHLRSIVFSHPDWTTAAAIFAAVEVALDDAAALVIVRDWLLRLTTRFVPNEGHCCWATAVAHAFQVLPGMPPDLLTPLKPWLESEHDEAADA